MKWLWSSGRAAIAYIQFVKFVPNSEFSRMYWLCMPIPPPSQTCFSLLCCLSWSSWDLEGSVLKSNPTLNLCHMGLWLCNCSGGAWGFSGSWIYNRRLSRLEAFASVIIIVGSIWIMFLQGKKKKKKEINVLRNFRINLP